MGYHTSYAFKECLATAILARPAISAHKLALLRLSEVATILQFNAYAWAVSSIGLNTDPPYLQQAFLESLESMHCRPIHHNFTGEMDERAVLICDPDDIHPGGEGAMPEPDGRSDAGKLSPEGLLGSYRAFKFCAGSFAHLVQSILERKEYEAEFEGYHKCLYSLAECAWFGCALPLMILNK